jgi:hypothetical protein
MGEKALGGAELFSVNVNPIQIDVASAACVANVHASRWRALAVCAAAAPASEANADLNRGCVAPKIHGSAGYFCLTGRGR